MCRPAPMLVAIALVLGPIQAAGEDECSRDCHGDVGCEIGLADCLIQSGRANEAVKQLKPLVREHPEEPAYARILARAYLADNNPFWAQRVLQKAIARDEKDCASRSWLAWVHIGQGDLDLAEEVLDRSGCPYSGADRARWALLRAYMSRTKKNHEDVSAEIRHFAKAGQVYPEDEKMWLGLRRAADPGWIVPLSIRLETGAGYTSNAKAGSPTDPGTTGPDSAIGRVDLFSRLVLPMSRNVRPALDLGFKGHGLSSDDASSLSYLELTAKPGLILGRAPVRVLLAYRADHLRLNQDEKERFYEGHRGEVEVETGGLTIFAGAGRRIFRESGRTRNEFDGGLGGSLYLHRRLQLLLASSLRYYQAVGDPYDQLGGTGLVVGRVDLGSGFYTRLGVTLGLDYHLNSGGERGKVAFGTDEKRLDVLTKFTAGVWSPRFLGARAGLHYEFSWHDSTADEGEDNYDFEEHRLLFKLRWTFDLNPWAPRVVEPRGHVALNYGLDEQDEEGLEEERIQDLLRQDEAARRGSSCVD